MEDFGGMPSFPVSKISDAVFFLSGKLGMCLSFPSILVNMCGFISLQFQCRFMIDGIRFLLETLDIMKFWRERQRQRQRFMKQVSCARVR